MGAKRHEPLNQQMSSNRKTSSVVFLFLFLPAGRNRLLVKRAYLRLRSSRPAHPPHAATASGCSADSLADQELRRNFGPRHHRGSHGESGDILRSLYG